MANQAYASFLKLDPVSRLTYVPTASSTLSQAKWYRVGKSVETLLLAALPKGVREELTAAR